MLYKNGERYILQKNEIDALKRQFHNTFPVKVTYPPERIVKSRSRHNRLPDKPNSISFDWLQDVKTEKGTEEWRYTERVTVDNKGIKHYYPKKFKFKGAVMLGEKDIEKIYFLFKKSEYCKGGENEGRITKCMFEDLVTEAQKLAQKKKLATTISSLLYGEKGIGLPAARLKELAKAMFVKNVDALSEDQIRIALDSKIGESKDGINRFLDLVNDNEDTKVRFAIQTVVDSGKLKYNTAKKGWYWEIDGQKPQFAVKVGPGQNAQEVLVHEYTTSGDFRHDVNAVILTGQKGKENDNTGDEE